MKELRVPVKLIGTMNICAELKTHNKVQRTK